MELHPIISAHNNNNNSSAHKEEEMNKPSEKSVETTASSVTAPSIHYIHDDCDDTTLNEGHHHQQQQVDHPRSDDKGDVVQQNLHDGDSGADVLPGYEICISSSPSSAESSAATTAVAAAATTVVANAAANSGEDEIIVQTPHNNVISNKETNIKQKPLPKTRPDSPLPNVLRCNEQQLQLAAAGKKKKTDVLPLEPSRHIYVLRQIIVDYVDDDEEEEEGGGTTCTTNINNENYGAYNDEEDDDDQIFYDAQEHFGTITIPPTPSTTTTNNNNNTSPPSQARIEKKKKRKTRLISTQMVQLSEEQHVKLEECSLGGTVLCAPSSWTHDDNNGGGDSDDGCDEPLLMPSSLDEGEEVNDDEELIFVDAVDEIVPEDSVEDQVAVVPYCTARRRMGCNCIKGAEGDDSNNKKDANEKKKRRRRPFKAAYQQIKRTLFYCHLNKKQSNEDTKNEGGGEDFCKECNYFGNNPPPKKGKRKVRHPRPSPHQFRNVGATLYGNEAVINNTAEPSESNFILRDILSSQNVPFLTACVSVFRSL
jgi:hypothetical protein